jgi:hypothetical protein
VPTHFERPAWELKPAFDRWLQTLDLAILSEQKSAKIISLLEEFRRNDPRDEVAGALAQPPMLRSCSTQ